MIVSKQELPGSLVEISIEESSEFVDSALERAYRKLVRQVDVPGWRRGKAPRYILERYVGREALCREAEREVLPELYDRAANDLGLDIVGDPEFKEVSLKAGEPLRFKVVVPVRPKAEPGDYGSLAIPFPEITVTPQEVDEALKRTREGLAHLDVLPEGEALKEGDFARIRVRGLEGGEAEVDLDREFPLAKAGPEERPIIPGLHQVLVGMKKGEARVFTGKLLVRSAAGDSESEAKEPESGGDQGLKAPEGTGDEKSQEKELEARFEVQVLDAYSRHDPADEELLKQTGKSSMEELRKDLAEFIRSQKFERAWREHARKVEDALLERGSVEIPEVMVESRTERLLDDFLRDIAKMGVKPEDYLRRTGLTWETLLSSLRDTAARQVKLELILEAIAEREGLTADEEELRAVISGIARDTGKDEETVKTTLEVRGAMVPIRRELTRSRAFRKIAMEAARRAGTPIPERDSLAVEPRTEGASGDTATS